MGRKPKFDERQLEEIKRRVAAGEPLRALAREFNCAASTISMHCSRKVERIKNAANKVFEADRALDALPVNERGVALSLADNMKSMALSLSRLAAVGAGTAVHLATLAQERAKDAKLQAPKDGSKDGSKVDKAVMDDVNSLNFAAGRAAAPALRLAAITQGREVPPQDPENEPDMAGFTNAQLDYLESIGEVEGA